jgi:hypothetical protein
LCCIEKPRIRGVFCLLGVIRNQHSRLKPGKTAELIGRMVN